MPYELPESARWIARGWIAVAVAGALWGGASAISMRIMLWSPGGDDAERYGVLTAGHGAAMLLGALLPAVFGALGNLAVPEAMRAGRMPTVACAWLGLVAWVLGAPILVGGMSSDTGWAFYDPAGPPSWLIAGLGAIAASLLFTSIHLGGVTLLGIRRAPSRARLVALGVLLPTIGASAMVVHAIVDLLREPAASWVAAIDQSALSGLVPAAVLASLAIVTHISAGDRDDARIGLSFIAIVLVAVWSFVRGHLVATVGVSVGNLALVFAWLRGFVRGPRGRHGAWIPVALGVAPALLVWAFARGVLARLDADVHLHDTYFVAGAFHLEVWIVAATFLSGILAWSVPLFGRAPAPDLARRGMVIACLGAIAHAITMLVLGSRGMPRRYASYLFEYTRLQQWSSLAAFAVAAGTVLLVAAFVVGHRPDEER